SSDVCSSDLDGIREHTMLRRCRLDLLLRLLRFFRRRLRMFLLSLSVRLERQLHENREVVGAAVGEPFEIDEAKVPRAEHVIERKANERPVRVERVEEA